MFKWFLGGVKCVTDKAIAMIYLSILVFLTVYRKVKKSKSGEWGAGFWRFRVCRGDLKEGVLCH